MYRPFLDLFVLNPKGVYGSMLSRLTILTTFLVDWQNFWAKDNQLQIKFRLVWFKINNENFSDIFVPVDKLNCQGAKHFSILKMKKF